jgi:glyceraldehyde 3-phosphate dehydrogenase
LFADPEALKKIKVAVINVGPATLEHVAHMFKYDTLMGTFSGSVLLERDELIVNGIAIKLIAITDNLQFSWRSYQVDWVVDCSGQFTHRKDALKHCVAGAAKVLISAPGHEMDCSVIVGINDETYDAKKHHIVSLGSCTTNAFIPLLYVLDNAYVVERGFMQTVHAYTNSQVLLDGEAKDLRFSRAAALNIIPTTTGASAMLKHIMPHLKDNIVATALRVPVGKVSLIDLALVVKNAPTSEEINFLFKNTATGKLKNILTISYDPLVSSDFAGDPHSVIVDSMMTQVIDSMIHVYGWYDNEWGYSVRIKDFLMQN